MRTVTGIFLMLMPLIYLAIMYYEAGILGVMLYFLYIVATLISLICPVLGYKLLKEV